MTCRAVQCGHGQDSSDQRCPVSHGFPVGQMVTSRMDRMLVKSEAWLDNRLPLTRRASPDCHISGGLRHGLPATAERTGWPRYPRGCTILPMSNSAYLFGKLCNARQSA